MSHDFRSKQSLRICKDGTGPMAQRLRVATVLAQDLVHTWWLTTTHNSSSREPMPSPDFRGHQTHVVDMCIYRHIK